jgi:hypothetical protein
MQGEQVNINNNYNVNEEIIQLAESAANDRVFRKVS